MSAARERAGRALYEALYRGIIDKYPWDTESEEWRENRRAQADIAHRASLDENDAALVEAMAASMYGGAWEYLLESHRDEYRGMAVAAIIAARNHITGGTE